MLSQKPYLVKALYQWCHDSGLTPYIVVHIDQFTQDLTKYSSEEQVVFNVSNNAVHDFFVDKDTVSFVTLFNGIAVSIKFPVGHVVAIFAHETNQGMEFALEIPDTLCADKSSDALVFKLVK